MRDKIYKILIILTVLLVLCVIEMIREQWVYKIRHYEIRSTKLNHIKEEIKIIFLSDLHGHEYGKDNCRLLQSIRENKPDFILCGGDMIIGRKGYDCHKVISFVEELTKIAPVYYANGNHEQRMHTNPDKYGDIYKNFKESLVKAGVTYLENETCCIEKNGAMIRLTGIELPEECYEHSGHKKISEDRIHEKAGCVQAEYYNILLAHHPSYMRLYRRWGADLALSGHFHGGVIKIPGIGGVISPQMGLFPKYTGGHYKDENMDIVVSQGLGTHTVNVRLFNLAELIVLHLKGED